MKKLFVTSFICGIIFSRSFGQISVNVLPTYNSIKTNGFAISNGFGIDAGLRFRSSKIVVLGFDTGYHSGIFMPNEPNTVYDGFNFSMRGGQRTSFVPMQAIIELQSIKHKLQFLGGAGLGMAFSDTQNEGLAESSILTSWHVGVSYRISNKIRILTKMKQNVGIFTPHKQDFQSKFSSSNFSFGINYQFREIIKK